MKPRHAIALAAVVAAVLAATAWIAYRLGRDAQASAPAPAHLLAPIDEPRALYWYDPMVPDQHFDKPGKSPFMDMQLVPKYADAGDAATPGVRIASNIRQNLGMRTVTVVRGALAAGPAVSGIVAWDQRAERSLGLPVDVVVERLFVRAPFDTVHAGQPLALVRASAWGMALAEAGVLEQAQSDEARALSAAAKARVRALGLPAGARRGKDGTITLVAPIDGVISEIAVREGQALPAGALLMRINGQASPWIEAALPAAAVAEAAPGTAVRIRADNLPGEFPSGHIEAVLPQVDASTRTRRARIVLDSPETRLVPGQFVQVLLPSGSGREAALLVPSEAVIVDGRGARVIVLAGGRFLPRAVETGRSSAGRTEILSGLEAGEKVVASGQFLIDSEANLSGALDRLGDGAQTP